MWLSATYRLWRYDGRLPLDGSVWLDAQDRLLYTLGQKDGLLIALDAATGARAWQYDVGSFLPPTDGRSYRPPGPTLSPDGDELFVGSGGGALLGIDPAAGRLLANYRTGGMVLASPAMSPDSTTVYLSSDHDGTVVLHALRMAAAPPL